MIQENSGVTARIDELGTRNNIAHGALVLNGHDCHIENGKNEYQD